MADQAPPAAASQVSDTPEAAALLLATFADFYRQEIGAEEDVHRTLPFYGTALGIVVGALAYAAGRLPKLPDITQRDGLIAFWVAGGLLTMAIIDAVFVLIFLSRAIARRDYQRVGPEAAIRARVAALQASYDAITVSGRQQDRKLAGDVQQLLLESYTEVTPINRELNRRRTRFRAFASSHLVRSLIWAFGATTVIFMADKVGCFPKVIP